MKEGLGDIQKTWDSNGPTQIEGKKLKQQAKRLKKRKGATKKCIEIKI